MNQRLKRDRLPSAPTLAQAGEFLLRGRFMQEARASLPGLGGSDSGRAEEDPEAVLAAVGLQRLRLQHDQQVPEWTA